MADGRHIGNRFLAILGAILADQCAKFVAVLRFFIVFLNHLFLSLYSCCDVSTVLLNEYMDMEMNDHNADIGHVPKTAIFENSGWRTAAILKIALFPYLSRELSDFDQI